MQERVPALVFTLRGRLYGLRQDSGVALLPWLQRYAPPSPVPGVPVWMLGLLNVQGTVQAIVDLAAFLGHGATTPTNSTRLIFVERHETPVGLLVDSAFGIRYMEEINTATETGTERFVCGTATVAGEHVHVLDGAALVDALIYTFDTLPVEMA